MTLNGIQFGHVSYKITLMVCPSVRKKRKEIHKLIGINVNVLNALLSMFGRFGDLSSVKDG